MEGLQEALASSLEELEQGRLTIDECLARYPQFHPELQKLLLTAQNLRQAPKVSPSVGFKLNARRRLIKRLGMAGEPSVTFFERIRRTVRGRYRPTSVRRRPAMSWLLISTIVMSILAGGGVGVAFAADGAAPGDALYGVDLSVEAIRSFFALDPEAKAQLALDFSDERLEELQDLISEGASDETIALALEGYSTNLDQAEHAMNQVLAGDGEQAGELLRLIVQQRLMLQNQLLIQVRNQVSTQRMSQVDQAIHTMEAAQNRVDEMLPGGGQGGPEDDAPGGPENDGQGGPPDDDQGGPQDSGQGSPSDDQGGNPEAESGGHTDDAPGEGQQEGTQGSDATPFENQNDALRECMDEVEALVVQGSSGALGEAAARCGETIEGMVASIAAANQGDTQQASTMAGLLNETLDAAVPKLTSLLANAPENAGTYINQVLTACEYGKLEMDEVFGNGQGQGGPNDNQQPTPQGNQGGKDH